MTEGERNWLLTAALNRRVWQTYQAEIERAVERQSEAGPARVVGNRRDEAIVAEREARAAAMSRRQMRKVG